jgi:hypothetical protein
MGSKKRRSNSKARLKKAQLSFYPEPADYAALKALSVRTGIPQQVYLREGLRLILKQRELLVLRADALSLMRTSGAERGGAGEATGKAALIAGRL